MFAAVTFLALRGRRRRLRHGWLPSGRRWVPVARAEPATPAAQAQRLTFRARLQPRYAGVPS
eukprot:1074269-Lingulodinium_polyedra.AAC.1